MHLLSHVNKSPAALFLFDVCFVRSEHVSERCDTGHARGLVVRASIAFAN